MTANAIVAATDGSEESLRAVEWAARESVLHGVPLRIVSSALVPKMVRLQIRPDRDAVAGFLRELATGPWPPRPPGPSRRPPAC
jgi:nucleotide-binding universal stress UspA family protein